MSKMIIMSDVHLCKGNWYGPSSEERLEKMVNDLNAAYEKEPYEAILFLGDYSLDFWAYQEGGTYVHEKKSNTARFIKDFLPRLTCQKLYLIPGNHEQYSNEKWVELTGRDRQFSVVIGGYLFILLDTFAKDLDPDYDSDGTYTTPDLKFIRAEMAKHPALPVVLCAHFFAMQRETAAFKEFLRDEPRIVCLFCGHDHISLTEHLGEDCGGKLIFHDGNYSYAGSGDVKACMWGWREVWFDAASLRSAYFTPASSIVADGLAISCEDAYQDEGIVILPTNP